MTSSPTHEAGRERPYTDEQLSALVKHAETLVQYGRWTCGPESPGHHPTMPSAVGQLAHALKPFAAYGYRPQRHANPGDPNA